MEVQILTMEFNFGSSFLLDNESTNKKYVHIHWDHKGKYVQKNKPVFFLQEVERHFYFFTWCNSRWWIKQNNQSLLVCILKELIICEEFNTFPSVR